MKPAAIHSFKGTLGVHILKTLAFSPRHGQGVARSRLQRHAGEVFFVDHGSMWQKLTRAMGFILEGAGTPSGEEV
jgi:hypothetical protein